MTKIYIFNICQSVSQSKIMLAKLYLLSALTRFIFLYRANKIKKGVVFLIYKQIGTTTNKLTKVNHKLSPFETIAMTPVEIIEDNENKENYNKISFLYFAIISNANSF